MKFIIIIALVIIAMIIISLLPLRFKFHYYKEGKDDFLSLTWQIIPGIWGITAEIPFLKFSTKSIWPAIKMATQLEGEKGSSLIKKEKRIALTLDKIKKILKKLFQFRGKFKEMVILGKWLLKKITIRKFFWFTEFGTNDAAVTGILAGLLWSLKTMIYQYLYHITGNFKKRPEFMVVPNFQQQKVAWNIICIFDITCGHIIIGGIKTLYILKKRRCKKFE